MIEELEYGNIIKDFIYTLNNEFIDRVEANYKSNLKAIILTGSFASWLKGKRGHKPSWSAIPDVNYYPIIRGSERDIISFSHILRISIDEVVKKFSKNESKYKCNILLDLHPFSISPTKPIFESNVINIQLTTRIINLDLYHRYPDYSWYGWCSNYILLYPHNKDLKEIISLIPKFPKRDEIWLRNMYLALLSYGNVLHMLPLYTLDHEHLFYEAYKYLKELAKDGVSIALTNEEFQRGELYAIITDWRNKIVNFYMDRYGKEAARIVGLLVDIDENYFQCLKRIDPIILIKDCITLRDLIFEKHFKRMKEILINTTIFDDLPLWW
jgi:hypothetical protein